MAEAQEILDTLFGMGMPDPTTWSPERIGVPGGEPRLRPAGQGGGGGNGEGETGSGGEEDEEEYLSWEDRQREAQNLALLEQSGDFSFRPGPDICEASQSCPPKDSSLDWTNPETQLVWFAQSYFIDGRLRYDEGITDLEAMAQIVEEAVEIYGGDSWETGILDGLSRVFLGGHFSGLATLPDALDPDHREGNILEFGDRGFHSDFRDDSNQVFHTYPYVHAVATSPPFLGQVLADVANHGHEILQFGVKDLLDFEIKGESVNDFVVSEVGIRIGTDIRLGRISPAELPDVLRERLSAEGTGSDGRIDEVAKFYPDLPRHDLP